MGPDSTVPVGGISISEFESVTVRSSTVEWDTE